MDRYTDNIDLNKYPMVGKLEEEICWMAERLREAREFIGDAPIIIEYDNGGGQKGTRKNPAYEAYEALMKTFIRSTRQLYEILADKDGKKSDFNRSALDEIVMMVNPLKLKPRAMLDERAEGE